MKFDYFDSFQFGFIIKSIISQIFPEEVSENRLVIIFSFSVLAMSKIYVMIGEYKYIIYITY